MIDFKEKLEIERIEKAVDLFAQQMKIVMIEKAKQGKRGWNNKTPFGVLPPSDAYIVRQLWIDVADVDQSSATNPITGAFARTFINIANRCMMLWFRHCDDTTGTPSPERIGSAWATSLNGEVYDHPFYASRADAVAAGLAEYNGEAFWIGEAFPPEKAEAFFDAGDWLENVSCQEDYDGDHAEGWDMSTKEQRAELEREVRPVMAAWLDRHNLRPTFFNVRNAVMIDPNNTQEPTP